LVGADNAAASHSAQISKNPLLKSIASGRDWNDVTWLSLYMLIMSVAFLGNFFAFATAQWDLADRDDRKACAHLDAKWFNLYSVPLTVSLTMWIVRHEHISNQSHRSRLCVWQLCADVLFAGGGPSVVAPHAPVAEGTPQLRVEALPPE
jgi:hypothetical protein